MDGGYTGSTPLVIATSNNTPSTSTTTGALLVAGGAGIVGNVNAGALYTDSIFYANGDPYVSGGTTINSIDDISDVDTTTTPPLNSQALVWNTASSLWKPGNVQISLTAGDIAQAVMV
jgi:hypothetical protein